MNVDERLLTDLLAEVSALIAYIRTYEAEDFEDNMGDLPPLSTDPLQVAVWENAREGYLEQGGGDAHDLWHTVAMGANGHIYAAAYRANHLINEILKGAHAAILPRGLSTEAAEAAAPPFNR